MSRNALLQENECEPLATKLVALLAKDGGPQGEEGVPGAGGLEVSPILLFWGTWGPVWGGDKEGSEDMGITAFFKITHLGSVHLLLFHHIIYFLLGENFSHYHNSTLKMYFSLILL